MIQGEVSPPYQTPQARFWKGKLGRARKFNLQAKLATSHTLIGILDHACTTTGSAWLHQIKVGV